MTDDEYNLLFHRTQANLSAFKRLINCDAEVIRMIEVAVEAEREACAKVCEDIDATYFNESAVAAVCANAIRTRGE